MALPRTLTPPADAATALHARAMDNLSFIRDTMERATAFTAVPGWGGVAMGVVALLAAAVAHEETMGRTWLLTWVGAAVVALGIGGGTMVSKARRAGTAVF